VIELVDALDKSRIVLRFHNWVISHKEPKGHKNVYDLCVLCALCG
jgi:hypothetical protein